jgi:ribosomal protein S18 acetylase RimI-like enzyme
LQERSAIAPGGGLVRRYEAADEGAVAAVWHRSGRAAYGYLPTWQAFEADEARRVFRGVILPSCDVWVAAVGAEVVGFLALKGAYVDRLYVDPNEQRRGWGTRLVEHAKGCQPLGLWLHTHQENRVARAFYERHGFTIVRFGTSPPPECAPDVEYRWRGSDGRWGGPG